MSKKQFTYLFILSPITIAIITGCLSFLLPVETILQRIISILLSLALGVLAGIIMAIVTIMFKNFRNED